MLPDKNKSIYAGALSDSIEQLKNSASILKNEWNREDEGKSGFLDVCYAAENDSQYNARGINQFVSYVNKQLNRDEELVPQL